MYLKNDKILVTIKDVLMSSHKLGLGNEFMLDPTAISGWTDGVSVRRENVAYLNAHGDFPEKATMSARVVSFSGVAVATSIENLQVMRDKLMGVLSNGLYGQLKVQTNAGARYSTVGLEGTPSWVQQTDTSALWRIAFYAPDPHIYGENREIQTGALTTRGGLEFKLSYPLDFNLLGEDTAQMIENRGNALSWPIFRVTGDYYAGFSITDNLGHIVTYSGMVTMKAPVLINMLKGTAIQGGSDKTSLVTKRDWFSIPVKSSIRPSFIPIQNGSGWCDIIYRDTWI